MSSILTTSAAAALAVLALAAPASAAHLDTTDESGDVHSRDAEGTWSSVGTRTNVDVVGSRVRHAPRLVTTVVRYDDLVRDDDRVVVPVRLHARGGDTYVVRVVLDEEDRRGRVTLLRYTGTGSDLERVPCRDLDHAVSYAEDRVTARVPRGCLGNPDWVRYGGNVRVVDAEGTVFTDALLSADALNDLYSERIQRA